MDHIGVGGQYWKQKSHHSPAQLSNVSKMLFNSSYKTLVATKISLFSVIFSVTFGCHLVQCLWRFDVLQIVTYARHHGH